MIAEIGARFPRLDPSELTSAQQAVSHRLSQGPRGGVSGPFVAWLQAPELAAALAELGDHVRFRSGLPLRIVELIVLLVAWRWRSGFIWKHHEPLALQEGLNPQVLTAVRLGQRPTGLGVGEAAACDLVFELLTQGEVGDPAWNQSAAHYDRAEIAEIVALAGYYGLVAMTLKTAGMDDDAADFQHPAVEEGYRAIGGGDTDVGS